MLKRIHLSEFLTHTAALLNARFLSMGLGIASSILLARILGPENKGALTAILVIPNMLLSFADLGFRQSTTYFIGKQVCADQDILSTLSLVSFITSLLAMLLAILVYMLNGFGHTYGWTLLSIALLQLPFGIVVNYGTGVLLGKKRINIAAQRQILVAILQLFLLFPLVLAMPADYRLGGALLTTALSFAFGALYILRDVQRFGSLRPRYIPGLPFYFLKMGVVYALALFVLALNYRVDILLLTRLSNSTEVGLYSVGVNLAQLLWFLPTALSTVNFAHSAGAKNHLQYAQKNARLLRIVLWGAIPPVILLYLVSPWLVPLVYGEAYAESAKIVQAILPGVWIMLIHKVLSSDLAGRGKPNIALGIYSVALVLNVLLNFLWIPAYGGIGSAWASNFSYAVGALALAIVYARISELELTQLFLLQKSDFQQFLLQFKIKGFNG